MKTLPRLLALALLTAGAMFAQTRFSFSISTGGGGYGPGYYRPLVHQQYVPVCPGPGYTWIDGYWAPQYGRRVWIDGYWRAPMVRGYRMAPGYAAPRYYNSHHGRGHYRGYRR